MYDTRLGRRWNVDPIYKHWESPYATFNNNPIVLKDPDGLTARKDGEGKNKVKTKKQKEQEKKRENMSEDEKDALVQQLIKQADDKEKKRFEDKKRRVQETKNNSSRTNLTLTSSTPSGKDRKFIPYKAPSVSEKTNLDNYGIDLGETGGNNAPQILPPNPNLWIVKVNNGSTNFENFPNGAFILDKDFAKKTKELADWLNENEDFGITIIWDGRHDACKDPFGAEEDEDWWKWSDEICGTNGITYEMRFNVLKQGILKRMKDLMGDKFDPSRINIQKGGLGYENEGQKVIPFKITK